MLGWSNRAALCASLRNRRNVSSFVSSRETTLTATVRPSIRSVARKTAPMPPPPMNSSSWKCPSWSPVRVAPISKGLAARRNAGPDTGGRFEITVFSPGNDAAGPRDAEPPPTSSADSGAGGEAPGGPLPGAACGTPEPAPRVAVSARSRCESPDTTSRLSPRVAQRSRRLLPADECPVPRECPSRLPGTRDRQVITDHAGPIVVNGHPTVNQ